MKKNIGNIDRVLRLIAGAAIIGAGFFFQSWWGALGIVPLSTAFIRWCPAYPLLGINTCKSAHCQTKDGGNPGIGAPSESL